MASYSIVMTDYRHDTYIAITSAFNYAPNLKYFQKILPVMLFTLPICTTMLNAISL